MTTTTQTAEAIRGVSGQGNAGLRSLLRRCTTRGEVLALLDKVAVTAQGEAKLRAVAETLPHDAEPE